LVDADVGANGASTITQEACFENLGDLPGAGSPQAMLSAPAKCQAMASKVCPQCGQEVAMRYKQIERIVIEIIETPNVPIKVVFAAARLFSRDETFPQLGPYRKRSVAQMLWRLASNSASAPEVRWRALRKLLALDATHERMESKC
jgi:hypothetical protein